MKHVFFLFVLSLVVGLCSCSGESNTESDGWNPDEYKKVYLRDLNAYAYVPQFFVYNNPIEYMKSLIAEGHDETIIESYKALASENVDYEIYVDSTSVSSSIIFYDEAEFIPIQDVGVSVVAGHLDRNFMKDTGASHFKMIDKKYLRTKKRELLKLKYEANIMDRYLYYSIYLITSNYRTIYVEVSSPGMGQDYQHLFEHIHLLRK